MTWLRTPAVVALGFTLLGACTTPPSDAYLSSPARPAVGVPVGTDARGEICLAQAGAAAPAGLGLVAAQDVFCGGWSQPAARLARLPGGADAERLDALASGGLWRSGLEQRLVCGAPQRTTLAGGIPARLLACTRRVGGWPHVALVAAGPDGVVLADGVATATPVMERLAAGQAAGGIAAPRSAALELAARRLAAEAFSATDVGRYEQLMTLGRELNQADNFAAAEDAYRAALAIQERVLGRDDPNIATALVHLALNLSNQARHQEAAVLFDRAAVLTPRAADTTAIARLEHYRGLAALNRRDPATAVGFLRRAATAYAALVPPGVLETQGIGGDLLLATDPNAQSAVIGLAEARRNLAIALNRSGRPEAAPPLFAESRALLRRTGLDPGILVARSLRAEAAANARLGNDAAATRQLEAAARRLAVATPGERPQAVTLFLLGARRAAAGDATEALEAFRAGAAILRARQLSLAPDLVLPYLNALDRAATGSGTTAPALRAEMFAATQLAQRSGTVRFVQQASARLQAAAGDPLVADAVRRLQDADATLRGLFAERDRGAGGAALDARIDTAQRDRAEAESEVAAAAPGYRQLLLTTVEAATVATALARDEAMVVILLGRDGGWTLALHNGAVTATRVALTDAQASLLVAGLRGGTVDADGRPGRFDPGPAEALYQALLAPLAPALSGAATLYIVPDGPLLGIPFGLLLTGPPPRDGDAGLAAAPWLVRRHAIAHIPAPATLVTLRAGPPSAAPLPWIGFGDFVPPTTAQLRRAFPDDRCAGDARLAAGLTRLPGTRQEIETAQALTRARKQDIRLGAAFTAASLRAPELGRARIVHLATHALLPGELSCLTEPSIVVSTPAAAPDASGAFVSATDLLGLKLDADLVILSACNTGGPGGQGGGEALSGLARAFFYSGARGLLVTHWAVDDAAASLTVADALRREQDGASSAAALRGAQLLFLEEAGRRLPVQFAHPFYWAPFALLGDGRRAARATDNTLRSAASG